MEVLITRINAPRYHGGWLAPNIYYLGRSGSVMIDGVRISGASCIYKPKDFTKGEWIFIMTTHLTTL